MNFRPKWQKSAIYLTLLALVWFSQPAICAPTWQCESDARTGQWLCTQSSTAQQPQSSAPRAPARPAATPSSPGKPASAVASSAHDQNHETLTNESSSGESVHTTACGVQPGLIIGTELNHGQTRLQAADSFGQLNRITLQGDVLIERSGQRLQADQVVYDQGANRSEAEGNVIFEQEQLRIHSSRGHTQIEGDQAEFENSQYELLSRGARGEAARVEVLDKHKSRLHQVTYTTCLPDDRDWYLRASKVDLDRATGEGRARNVTLRVGAVPVFYTPYLSFPIDDRRKTGLLVPSFGNSDKNGVDISVPWYWNIAPNRDATFTPRILSERGLQLAVEYRYLQASGQGEMGAELLPDDDLARHDRYLFTYKNNSRFGQRWSVDANLAHASDRDYFTDLGETLSVTSQTNLERRIDLTYGLANGYARLRAQNFQPMDTTTETYARLPQLEMVFRQDLAGDDLYLDWHSEWVRFDHQDNVTTGSRLDLYPALVLDWQRPAGFIRPRLGYRYTAYDLDGAGLSDDSPDRALAVASIDSGLFFERDTNWFGDAHIQTLEPRLYYLYVPHEDQSDLPVFDSGRHLFGFDQLYRDNRFSGADRHGDANQLTVALTSRFISPRDGAEKLRLSIGQIHYFDDRRVVLPGESIATRSDSDIVAEAAYSWPHANINLAAQYDPDAQNTARTALRWHYQTDDKHILNLTYRFERGVHEQTDVSGYWPMGRRWQALARWNYSLREQRTLEGLLGMEYNSCCWGVRLAVRRYITGVNSEDTAVYLQFVFKGLGQVGDRLDSLLEEGILGYRDVLGVQ